MENEDTKQTTETKKFERSDYIYGGVIILFLFFVLIIFFNSTNFILSNINKIFAKNVTNTNQSLDTNRYSLVSKKLNLPVNTSNIETLPLLPGATQDNTTIPIPGATESASATQNPTSSVLLIQNDTNPTTINATAAAAILDKKSITINIVNAARIANVASALAKHLEDAGFSKATTSSVKNSSASTTILIKKNKAYYTNSILDIVKNIYPGVSVNENPEKSNFDVIITIGK